MTILIADLRCSECGSEDIVAIAPGQDEDRSDLFLLQREVPVRCRCMECWPIQSVDGTRVTRQNQKPPTVGKTVSGLTVNQAGLGGCVGGPLHPHPTQASRSGQGGFA